MLSTVDLTHFDPRARTQAGNCRVCCPLCGTGKPVDAAHRSLSYNTETGAYLCHRCKATGLLQEYQSEKRSAVSKNFVGTVALPSPVSYRKSRRRDALQHLQRLSIANQPIANEPVLTAPTGEKPWRRSLTRRTALTNTSGAAYLEGRGLSTDFCTRAGVQFSPDFYGRPAVLFAVQGGAGELVAAQGRYIDGLDTPRMRTTGNRKHGVFATPGAFDSPVLVIVEAPIDALTLALSGLPAVALCGSGGVPDWLIRRSAFKTVYAAFDADEAGQAASVALANVLAPVGGRVHRLSPEVLGAKDWNDALQRNPDALRNEIAELSDGLKNLNSDGVFSSFIKSLPPSTEPVTFPEELLEAGREADAALYVQTGENEVLRCEGLSREAKAVAGEAFPVQTKGLSRAATASQECNNERQIAAIFPAWLARLALAERAGWLPQVRQPFPLPSGAAARDVGLAVRNGITLWRGAVAQSERNARPVTGYCPRRRAVLALSWLEIAEREEADLRALAKQFIPN